MGPAMNILKIFLMGPAMNILKISLLSFLAISLPACATPTYLSKFDNTTSSLSATDGVIYFLPRQLHQVELTQDDKCMTTLKITESDLVPDTKLKFIIKPYANSFRDDTLNLKTTPAGLLSSTASTSDGKLDEIVVDIAGAIASFGSINTASVPNNSNCAPKKSIGIYDLAMKQVRDDLVKEAKEIKFDLKFENQLDTLNSTILDQNLKTKLSTQSGIFYRRPVTYTAVVSCLNKSNCAPEIINLNLPQAGPIGYIIPKGSSLSAESDTLTFENGLLTDWNTVRKSPVAEIAKLPVEIAQEIITVPSSLLTLRTQNLNDLASLEQARTGIESATTANTSSSIQNERAILLEELRLEILRLCVAQATETNDSVALNECFNAGSN